MEIILFAFIMVVGIFVAAFLQLRATQTTLSRQLQQTQAEFSEFSTTILTALANMNLFMQQTQNKLSELSGQISSGVAERLKAVDETNRQSFERLTGDIRELRAATEQVVKFGERVASLEDLLKPPKLRGGMGETLLEQLLEQVLPREHYRLQHPFRSGGVVVDAVVELGDGLVPIDSKFPLEEFKRLQAASQNGEEEVSKRRRRFIRVVKRHIDDIAQKYILPDERTFDFALMYIPAENLYYEAIIRSDDGNDVFSYALEKRVIPVSPHTFYAYLLVIVRGLRGMRIEERARAIMGYLKRLEDEERGFRSEFNTLGKHLKNAQSKYDDAVRKLGRWEDILNNTTSYLTEESEQ